MRRFKRKGAAYSRIEDLSHDHFTLRKSGYHGFPMSPSALNYDPDTHLLAIGTSTGEFRIYGQPGVEFAGRINAEKSIEKIYSFGSLHQYITVQDDNSLLLWQLEGEEGLPHLRIASEFQLEQDGGKCITSCCLSKLAGHFYIGTEGGNIYTLDVKLFMLKPDEIINWANATALVQSSSKVHPGSVCSIELCPTNLNKLLIGYEKGIIVLWDVTQPLPERNFPSTIEDCKQPLRSISWHREGQKFISAHSDSSIYTWSISSSTPEEGPIKHYGETCEPIQRIEWLNTISNPLFIFSGGQPTEDADDHNTVTVIQGTEHVALDFSSKILDFATVIDPQTKRGKALIILCQQEAMAFDLEAPKCPQIKKPYLYSIHSSPVTCLKVYDGCPKDLLDIFKDVQLINAANKPNDYVSNTGWPAVGGFLRVSDPPTFDLLITGHSNGTVKFWDITSSAMYMLFEIKTGLLFQSSETDGVDFDDMAFSEFQWPPYRKVGTYDPYDDDTRLSIRLIEFCPYSCKLCVAGEGGQTLTYAFNPMEAEIRVEYIVAEIFVDSSASYGRARGVGLRNTSPLEFKTDFMTLPAGFQPSLCVQCLPSIPITALAFRPSWGLVAASNNKGFMVANFYTKLIVLVHPTVMSDGVEVRNIGRVQSMRRSLRSSLRRRSSTIALEERRKIAASFNLETGEDEGGKSSRNRRAMSADAGLALNDGPLVQVDIPPEQRGIVTYLVFAETHISGGGPHVSVLASTVGSSVIRYSIEVPKGDLKYSSPNRAFPAGKDYALVHAAPIVALFILDHDAQPLPSPCEVEKRAVPAPNMSSPHYVVIVTQEQIKIISLPSMRSKRKEKVNNLIHERISKAWMIKVKVPAAPVGASRDWNSALAIITTIGHLLIYSLPDIKLTYHKDLFILPSDQKAMQSLTISPNGETFHLRSFSEFERRLLCSYNFSYHTSLLPNLHPYDSSSGPQRTNRFKKATSEASSNNTPPPSEGSATKESKNIANSQRFRSSVSGGDAPFSTENSVRSRSLSPTASASIERKKSEVVERKKSEVVERKKSEAIERKKSEAVAGNGLNEEDTRPVISSTERDVLASAAAFTQAYNTNRERSSSTSSSSDSESSESEEEDDDEMGEGGQTFVNPLMDNDFGDDSQELDTIIASSLQQLESARSFYERMQKQARGDGEQ